MRGPTAGTGMWSGQGSPGAWGAVLRVEPQAKEWAGLSGRRWEVDCCGA